MPHAANHTAATLPHAGSCAAPLIRLLRWHPIVVTPGWTFALLHAAFLTAIRHLCHPFAPAHPPPARRLLNRPPYHTMLPYMPFALRVLDTGCTRRRLQPPGNSGGTSHCCFASCPRAFPFHTACQCSPRTELCWQRELRALLRATSEPHFPCLPPPHARGIPCHLHRRCDARAFVDALCHHYYTKRHRFTPPHLPAPPPHHATNTELTLNKDGRWVEVTFWFATHLRIHIAAFCR